MTKVLLTGSTGALGLYLKRRLKERNECRDWNVFCLSRDGMETSLPDGFHAIQGDFLDQRAMRNVLDRVRPDLVFHLAWETKHGTYWEDLSNEEWSSATIEFAHRFAESGGRYFGFAGTCAEYSWGEEILIENSTAEQPDSYYGQQKLRTTRALLDLGRSSSLVVNCSRVFFPFCAEENPNRVTSLVVRKLMRNEKLNLNSGDVYRDICHTRHVAQAMLNMAINRAQGIYNVATGEATHLGSLLARIASSMGKRELLTWDVFQEGGQPSHIVGSSSRITPFMPQSIELDADIEAFTKASFERFSKTQSEDKISS